MPKASNRVMTEELRRLETQAFPASATTANGSAGVPSVWTWWVRRSYRDTAFSVRWLVQIPLGVTAIRCGSAPTGVTETTFPLRGSIRTRLFGTTCGDAPADLERRAAAAAEPERMTTAASASCQRRGRNRVRVRSSLASASVLGVGGAVFAGASPLTAAVPSGVSRDGSWRRIACWSRCSGSLGSMPRSSTRVCRASA